MLRVVHVPVAVTRTEANRTSRACVVVFAQCVLPSPRAASPALSAHQHFASLPLSTQSFSYIVRLVLFAPHEAPLRRTIRPYSYARALHCYCTRLELTSASHRITPTHITGLANFFDCSGRFFSCSLPISLFTSDSSILTEKYFCTVLNSEFLRVPH